MRNPFRRKPQSQNEWEPVRQPDLNPELAHQLHNLTNQWADKLTHETYSQATYNILVCAFQAHEAALVAEGERHGPGTIGGIIAGLSDYQYDESLWGDAFTRPPVRPKYTETMPLLRGALGYPEPRSKPSVVTRSPAGNLSPETRRRTGANHVSQLDDTTGYNPLIGSGYTSGILADSSTVGEYAQRVTDPTPVSTYSPPETTTFGGGAGGYASGGDTSSPSSYDSGSTSY